MSYPHHRKALLLSYITVFYNIAEGLISILAGSLANSIALIGFGLDSFVESSSGFVMIWRFRKNGKISIDEEKKIEKKATRFVAYTFFILGAYIVYESVSKLYFNEKPEPSLIGIIIAAVSIIAMPVLFYSKYMTGKAIGSKALIADSKETLACMFMSVALLLGLVLNYLYGYWQADPIVGMIIFVFLFKESVELLREEEFCEC